MTKEYTLQQARTDMMKMWLWLIGNPTKNKYYYFNTHRTRNFPFNCPLCLYVGRTNFTATPESVDKNTKLCSLCPVEWSNIDEPWIPCLHSDSPFQLWEQATTVSDKIKHATRVYSLAKNIDTYEQKNI